MKKFISFVIFCFFLSLLHSQTAQEIFDNTEEDFNVDDIFDSSQDMQTPLITEEKENKIKINDFSIPLSFSGNLSSELGLGFIKDFENDKSTKNGYVDFDNYLYLSSFPTKNLGVRSTFYATFPNYQFSVYEMYFDYVFLDKLYITVGKKATSWGCVRLFTTSEDDDEKDFKSNFGFETNILSDTRSGTSVLLRLPIFNGTISALSLYNGSDSKPEPNDLNFAGSFEFSLGKTMINLFGRKYPSNTSSVVSSSCKPLKDSNGNEVKDDSGKVIYQNGLLTGFELKRNFWGADAYLQGIAKFYDNEKVVNLVKHFDLEKESFGNLVYTIGIYRWWDSFDPNFGFNLEFQEEYLPQYDYHNRRIGVDMGLKRLGSKKNIKIGTEWMHSITNVSGYVKPGVIITSIFSNVDWNNGIKFEYTNSTLKKMTFGTYLKFALNY